MLHAPNTDLIQTKLMWVIPCYLIVAHHCATMSSIRQPENGDGLEMTCHTIIQWHCIRGSVTGSVLWQILWCFTCSTFSDWRCASCRVSDMWLSPTLLCGYCGLQSKQKLYHSTATSQLISQLLDTVGYLSACHNYDVDHIHMSTSYPYSVLH